jgi:hypothetical protein
MELDRACHTRAKAERLVRKAVQFILPSFENAPRLTCLGTYLFLDWLNLRPGTPLAKQLELTKKNSKIH